MSKILFVDDEMAMRNLCYEIFTRARHEVVTAPRGDEALVAIRSSRPDLVLMDVHIPGERGLSLLKKIRAENSQLPVVVFTAFATAEIEKEAYEEGAVEVIQKGIPVTELRDKVEKILASKERLLGEAPKKAPGEKILIVDDDENVRKLLTSFFSRKGFVTLTAKSGEEAISLAQQENPTLAILDITLPGMDGILTLKRLREINPHLGVVMATGTSDEQMVKEAMALGAYHYILKPFDLKYLDLVVLTRLTIAS